MSQWIQEYHSKPSQLPQLYEAGGMDCQQVETLQQADSYHNPYKLEFELTRLWGIMRMSVKLISTHL